MFNWHTIPFVRLLVPFILGIFYTLYLPVNFFVMGLATLILLSFIYYYHVKKSAIYLFKWQLLIGISISILVFFLACVRTHFHNERNQPYHFSEIKDSKFLELVVDDGIVEKSKFYRCYAKVIATIDSSKQRYFTQGTVLLYLRKGQKFFKPQVGNHYIVNAEFKEIPSPANPEEFNYKQYLSYHNIYFQLFLDSSNCINRNVSTVSLYRYACGLRDQTLAIIQSNIKNEQSLGVAEALLMGYKDDLDPNITAAFMRTGTLHVLAVSGMHAGIIYLILAFLTQTLASKKWGKYFQVIILLIGIWMYAFMTGLSSSVLRASVMFSFMTVGKLFKYHINVYNTIYASAFILLLYNPRFIVDVGFQLSYLAVLGIIFLQPFIQKWYKPRWWFDRYVWSLISVSLAAQLLTFPISIFYFHQFPNYFILSNLLIIPITSLILIGLIVLIALGSFPVIAGFIGLLLDHLIQFNNWLVISIDKMPYAYVNGLNLNLIPMLLLYAAILLTLIFVIHRLKWAAMGTLAVFLSFFSIRLCETYTHSRQKLMVVHHIKGHDVYSCIDGQTAYLFSDSSFLANESSLKFFIEPFYWKQGIKKVLKCDMKNSFVSTNIFYDKNVGFQFFDTFLTIDKILRKNVQKNGILILKTYRKDFFKKMKVPPKFIKYGVNINPFEKRKFEKAYFKHFGTSLKDSKYFILIRI